ncbi:MAG: SEL1-like repeat protein [Gammaproteobacteria bacterium]|nr:SEL1-like repeat protein [Gammaproteobacteria bacterium]
MNINQKPVFQNALVVGVLFLNLAAMMQPLQAEVREYIREYDYAANEYDTEYSSRISAIDELKLSLQHELGTYISSILELQQNGSGNGYINQKTVQLSAGIISLKLIEQRWDKISYFVKGAMQADRDEILESIKALRSDYELELMLRESFMELDQLRAEVASLKVSLQTLQGAEKTRGTARYQAVMQDIEVENIYQLAMSARLEGNFSKAFELLKGLADKGYSKAQLRVGHLLEKGVGVKQDYRQAMEWFNKANDQGDSRALAHIGFLYERGLGVAKDELRALSLYKQALDKGSMLAAIRLGHLYVGGIIVPRDYDRALQYFSVAAEKSDQSGLAWMGFMYERGHAVKQDYSKAVDYFEQAIGAGSAWAMGRLGNMYLNGMSVDRDIRKAHALIAASAERGNGFGIAKLGELYENGQGVDKDEKRAFELYQKSADSGSVAGFFRLGHAYHKGIGVKQNRRKAIEWYRKAEQAGHPGAIKRLNKMGA